MYFGAIDAIEVLIKMRNRIIFILSNAADVRSIEELIQIGDIVQTMNQFMGGVKCLSMTHAQNGSKGNGNLYLKRPI